MDTKVIEVRKNVTILQRIDSKSEFQYTIANVSFVPDEVIVKNIYYDPDGAEQFATYLYTDLVSDYIGHFYGNQDNITAPHFALKKSIAGTYNFKILNIDATPNATRVGDISIVLDFVKYREAKVGKIY